jgi:putative oxidoreductase
MKFPFISLHRALILLRICVACIFLAHAIVRITGGTVERFAGFLEGKGFPFALTIVWLVTVYEIAGGVLLLIGKLTPWISLGFILMLLIGIVVIHAPKGWFVGEHGSGGIEYSFILIITLIVIAATNKKSRYRR